MSSSFVWYKSWEQIMAVYSECNNAPPTTSQIRRHCRGGCRLGMESPWGWVTAGARVIQHTTLGAIAEDFDESGKVVWCTKEGKRESGIGYGHEDNSRWQLVLSDAVYTWNSCHILHLYHAWSQCPAAQDDEIMKRQCYIFYWNWQPGCW